MTKRDDELWLEALQGKNERSTTLGEREALLLRDALLTQAATLDELPLLPGLDGYSIARARVHQQQQAAKRSVHRRKVFLTVLGTITLLATIIARTVTFISIPITRGGETLTLPMGGLDGAALVADLEKSGGDAVQLTCWTYARRENYICLSGVFERADLRLVSVTHTKEVEEYLISKSPPIIPFEKRGRTFFIRVADGKRR